MEQMYLKIKRIFGKRTARIVGELLLLAVLFLISIMCKIYQKVSATTFEGEVVVCIDPGHGGNDPGKLGITGVMEKDINLSIGLKLKEELEKRNVKVVMTRTTDICLADDLVRNKKTADMNKRIEILESSKADIFISIHQNSYPDTSVKGAQCFFYKGSYLGENLAKIIQGQMIKTVDSTNKRKAKSEKDLFVLRKSSCPAVIIECGFLSCPREEEILKTDAYQSKIAKAIADGIMIYEKEK